MTTPTQPEATTFPLSTILIVDDEVGILETYQQYLSPVPRARPITSHRMPRSHPVSQTNVARLLTATSGERAVEIMRDERAGGRRVQAAFFDMKMPGGIDGLETMRRILEIDADLMCVVVTAYTDQPLDEIRALFGPTRQDDWDYLNKPFNSNEVSQKARNAVSSWWRRRHEEAQASELHETNFGLAQRIAERTRSLSEANAELERGHHAMAQVLTDLRTANDRLQVEMLERGRLEAERRLTSRLESVGQLAAGIAHEINTPTQYIMSNAEVLEQVLGEWLPEVHAVANATAECAVDASIRSRASSLAAEMPNLGTELNQAVGSVLHGARSIARIVSAMRDFARVDSPEMRPADLNRAIEATLDIVRHVYSNAANIELSLEDIPPINCHVGEIQQVLTNLIVNAAHAIEQRAHSTGGRIAIGSRFDAGLDCVVISIDDNGTGIAPELHDRVFDPFFTTKPVGRGTGQGLTIARNVVVRHGGTLTFESELGRGTTFVMSLPRHAGAQPS